MHKGKDYLMCGGYMFRRLVLLIVPLVLLLIASPAAHAHNDGFAPGVLFVASYHKGDVWTDRLIEAFESRVRQYRIDLDIHYEFMDRRRFGGPRQDRVFLEYLRGKYGGTNFDVIVCSDEEALAFLSIHRNDLFPDVPVVFAGLNDLSRPHIGGTSRLTGVAEAPDPRGTVQVALKLLPDTATVAVINDPTAEGRVLRKIVEHNQSSFPGVSFVFLENLPLRALLKRLQELPQNTIVLQMAYDRRKEEDLSFVRYLQTLSKSVNIPVFSLWDHTIGCGAVGGHVVTAFGQGDEAGRLVAGVLQGEKVQGIPVVLQEANLYMFDDRQLRRFAISRRLIPDNSTIVAGRVEGRQRGKVPVGDLALPGVVVGLTVMGVRFFRKRRQ